MSLKKWYCSNDICLNEFEQMSLEVPVKQMLFEQMSLEVPIKLMLF
jgi:hypothetical protein